MRWKRVLIIGAAAVLVGGIGAVSALLLTYHEATKIDRSNPKVVTDEYLRAELVRKDEVGAELYSCSRKEALAAIRQLKVDLGEREKDDGVTILVSWGAFDRVDNAGSILLTANLTITARKGGIVENRTREAWRFTLIDDDGWRVCGAERLPTPTPTASPTPPATTPTTTRSPAAP